MLLSDKSMVMLRRDIMVRVEWEERRLREFTTLRPFIFLTLFLVPRLHPLHLYFTVVITVY